MSSPEQPALVSILIVNYQAYQELAGCLDSLRRFAGDDVEVIVVDHASDPAAATDLVRRFPEARVLTGSGNPGFAAGVNRAARSATGRYFLLLNPDSVVDGDVARELARWLDQHPRVGVCGGLVREVDGSVQASARRFPNVTTGFAGRTSWLSKAWPKNRWSRRNLVTRDVLREPVDVDWVSGACMMVRRNAFESVGGMDETFFLYWEDADLCVRLKQAGWSTSYNPRVGITHLTGRSSARARRLALIAFHQSAYRYYRKHGGRAARVAAPVAYLALQSRLLLKLASLELSRAFRHPKRVQPSGTARDGRPTID